MNNFLERIDTPFEFYLLFLLVGGITMVVGLIFLLVYMIKHKISTAYGLTIYPDKPLKEDLDELK